jgi:hypothetical protein
MIYRLHHKIDGKMKTARIVHITSSRRSHEDEAKDKRVDAMGCIKLFYPNFTVFVVLDHKNSLVISFSINRTLRVNREVSIQQFISHPLAIVAF